MKYGYVRVSTADQKLDRQLNGIKLDKIFSDKQSGKDMNRKGYKELRSTVISGDEIYIHALDRLGRNKNDIKAELEYYKSIGVVVRIMNMPTTMIDYGDNAWIGDMINNIILEVLSTIAEHERDELIKRTKEGIEAARRNGKQIGRSKVDVSEAEEMIKKGVSVSRACKEAGISRSSYYKSHRAS